MDIAGLVRAAREQTGFSQKALAERAGITPSTLSRLEAGAALPSLPLLNRVLAACGKDAHWTLVHRLANVDGVLDRLAAVPLWERLYSISMRCQQLVSQLAVHDVLIGGAWAAALHGLPHEHQRGRIWLAGDEQTAASVAAIFRRYMVLLLEDGQPIGPAYDEGMLLRHADRQWQLQMTDVFRVTTVLAGQPWPAEVRLSGTDGFLRVVLAQNLSEDEDGVRPEVLARWVDRRS